MDTKRLAIAAITVTTIVAACGGDGGAATSPSAADVSSAEATSTTVATSTTTVPTPLATTAVPITVDTVGELALVEEYDSYVWLDFTPDDRWIALHGEKVALLDRASGELDVLVDEVIGQIYSTAISPDGRYILFVTLEERFKEETPTVAESYGFSRVWDVQAGAPAVDMNSAIGGAVFLPNGMDLIVAGSSLYWMDLSTGESIDHGFEERSTPQLIELMPDGTTLVTDSNGVMAFDSVETGEEIKTWDFTRTIDGTRYGAQVTGVSVSPDGALVAVGVMSKPLPELNAIHLIDYESDEAIHVIPYELTGRQHELNQVALSPDGSLLVAGFQEVLGSSGRLELFDVASGEPIGVVPVEGAVQRVAFSPDGTLLAVGTTRRTGLKMYAVIE